MNVKKLLALLLALTMIFSLALPISVFADEGDPIVEVEEEVAEEPVEEPAEETVVEEPVAEEAEPEAEPVEENAEEPVEEIAEEPVEEAVEEEADSWEDGTVNVAKIGETEYATLQGAIDAAQSGATVTLLADVTGSFTINKSLTLTAENSAKIGCTSGTAILVNANNVEVTLDGVTVYTTSFVRGVGIGTNCTGVKLTIKDSSVDVGGYAIDTRPGANGATIAISGSTINGYCAMNIWGNGSTITANSSTLGGANKASQSESNDFGVIVLEADTSATTGGALSDQYADGNTITCTGCTIGATTISNKQSVVVFNANGVDNVHAANADYLATGKHAKNNTVIFDACSYVTTTTGGLVYDGSSVLAGADASTLNASYGNKFIVKTSGTYTSDPTAYLAEGYKAVNNGDGTWTVQPITYVAEIVGDAKYETLKSAFAAVETGQTITLLTNVTLSEPLNVEIPGKSVTLDLGGYTLTGRTNLKSGRLTIQNGTVAGGDQQALNVYGSSDSTAENYSVLTIASNVTVTANVYAVCMFGNTAGTNGYGAVVNMNGTITTTGDGKNGAIFVSGNLGKNVTVDANNVINVNGSVTSATDAAIALNGLATVNVNTGATVTGDTAIAVKRGTLNVTGGTITANGDKSYPGTVYYNGTEMTGAAISITETYSEYGPLAVNITGGSIKSANADAVYKRDTDTYKSDATVTISGGVFSSELDSDFVANGCEVVANPDEATKDDYPYTVAVPVAKIDETKYATLAAAVEAAQDGNTITLLKDIDLPAQIVVSNKTVTLNLDGNTISNTNDIWDGDDGWSLISVQNGGELTVTGNGTMTAKENDCYVFDVRDGGKLTIKSGTFSGNVTAVYAYEGSVAIEGGTFRIQQLAPNVTDDRYRYTLNCLDTNYANDTASFTVTGGSFYMFNPENNQAEGSGTNFVADGYEAVQNGDYWTVQKHSTHSYDTYVDGVWRNINGNFTAVFTYACACDETKTYTATPTQNTTAETGYIIYTAVDPQNDENSITMKKPVSYTVTYGDSSQGGTGYKWGDSCTLAAGVPSVWKDASGTILASGKSSYSFPVTGNIEITSEAVTGEVSDTAVISATLGSSEEGKAVYQVKWSLPDGATVTSAIIYRGMKSGSTAASKLILVTYGSQTNTGLLVRNGDFTLNMTGLTSDKYQNITTVVTYEVDNESYELVVPTLNLMANGGGTTVTGSATLPET